MALFKSLSDDEIMHHPVLAIEAEQTVRTVQAQNNQQYKISGQLLLDFQRHFILGHVENSYSPGSPDVCWSFLRPSCR